MSWFKLSRSTDPHKQRMLALTDDLQKQIRIVKTSVDSDAARVALKAIKNLSADAQDALNTACRQLKPGKKFGSKATALFKIHQEAQQFLNPPKAESLAGSKNQLQPLANKYSERDLLVLVPKFEAIAVDIEQDLKQTMKSFENQKNRIVDLSNQFMLAEEGRVELERRLAEFFSPGSFRFNLATEFKKIEKMIFAEWDDVQELGKYVDPEKAFQIKKKLIRELGKLKIKYAHFERVIGGKDFGSFSISSMYNFTKKLKEIQADYHKLAKDIELFSRLKTEYVQDMVQIADRLAQIEQFQKGYSKDEWQKFLKEKEEQIVSDIYDLLSEDAPAELKTPSVSKIKERLDAVGLPVDFGGSYTQLHKAISEYQKMSVSLESFPGLQSRVQQQTREFRAVLAELKSRIAP